MDQPAVDLPLVSLRRERRMWLQKVPHVVPAIVLLGAGFTRLKNGDQGFGFALAVGELLVSALLLRMLAKEIGARRQPHVPHDRGIDWFDVCAAGVLTAEALEHWHHTGHLPRPMVLTAALTLALGLFHRQFHGWIGHRRSLRIDDEGIRFRARFRRELFAPWPDVERIDLDDREARIFTRRGEERRIDLTDMRHASEIREALLAARERLAGRDYRLFPSSSA